VQEGAVPGHYRGFLSDTWTWDGTIWTGRSLPADTDPPAMSHPGMAYDAARNEIVVQPDVDVGWSTWTMETPSKLPPFRSSPGAAYDAVRRNVVVFGGCNYCDETWLWDG
jgi:hypothetical protein